MDENALEVLLGLATSGTLLAQENAIVCLCNLVLDDENLKLLIAKEGGIESLKNFWDSVSAVRSFEVAVELLRHLASCHPIAEVLASDGFVARLVNVLVCGVLGARIVAAQAVYQLGISSKARKEMGECWCIGPLIKILDGKAVEEKESAAKVLSTLLLYAGYRKIFRKDERGIVSTVQLLDPLIQNLDKKIPVAILAALVHCSKCRKLMVAAGACLHLQKLAEMDVQGGQEAIGKSWTW